MWCHSQSVRESGTGSEEGGESRGQSHGAVWAAMKSPDFDLRAQGRDYKDVSQGMARSASCSTGLLLLALDGCVSVPQTAFQKIKLGSTDLI